MTKIRTPEPLETSRLHPSIVPSSIVMAVAQMGILASESTSSVGRIGAQHRKPRRPLSASQQRQRAADREEMQSLLAKLKQLVPGIPKKRKLSKLEIIQHVIDYIFDLQVALESHPINGAVAAAAIAEFQPHLVLSGAANRAFHHYQHQQQHHHHDDMNEHQAQYPHLNRNHQHQQHQPNSHHQHRSQALAMAAAAATASFECNQATFDVATTNTAARVQSSHEISYQQQQHQRHTPATTYVCDSHQTYSRLHPGRLSNGDEQQQRRQPLASIML